MRKKLEYKKNLKRNIPLMAAVSFFAQFRFYYPVAVLMYHAITGSYALAMSVFAVLSTSILIFEIPTGILSDKWGRKPLLILESICIFIATLFYAIAFSSDHGIYWLYTGAVIYGGVVASRTGNREAILYETLDYYKKQKSFAKIHGRMYSMSQSALACSGIVGGGLLWAGFTFQHLALFTLIPLAINICLTFFLIEPKKHSAKKEHSFKHLVKAGKLLIKRPRLRWYALAATFRYGLGMSSHTFMPGFIASVWPVWAAPLFRTAQHGLGAVSFWFSGAIIKKFGPLKILWGTSVYGGLFSFTAYLLQNAFAPILLLLTQIGYAPAKTADGALQQENFTEKQRSTMGSLISFMTEILTSIAAILVGYLADIMGPAEALMILLMLKIIPVNLIYAHIYKVDKRKTSTRKS